MKPADLQIGDIVLCRARRVSASYGAWGRQANKNHGEIEIRARVEYDPETDGKQLVAFKEDIEAAERPKGKEQKKQQVYCLGRAVIPPPSGGRAA